MRVTLKEFRYYLRVQGKDDDGIFSMTCIFRFLREPGDSVAEIRARMDRFVARYEAIFDPLFESIIDGEKLPTLRDSPGKTQAGYRYAGCLTEAGIRERPAYLRETFGMDDPQSVYSPFRHQRVDIMGQIPATEAELDSAILEVDSEVDHGLQVCLFRFLQGRDDLDDLEPEARKNVDRLDNTLAETAETGQDHFRRLMDRKAPVIPLK